MQEAGPAAIEGPRTLRLYRDEFPGAPVLDTAVSHALLRRVAAGTVGESLRLYSPGNALLFSSLDARRPGYARAVALAEQAGFPAVIRLAGGHAAAFLESSIAFAWASADVDAHLHIRQRFEALSGWIVDSLRRLGLDARVGSLPGEYCPGEYSVNIGGRIKVMGVGQRVIRGGAHVGGVLTIAQTEVLRELLTPIYAALEFDFRSETVGGIGDVDARLDAEQVVAMLGEVLREDGYEITSHCFDAAILRDAETLLPLHGSEGRGALGALLRTSQRAGKVVVAADQSNSPKHGGAMHDC